MTPENNGNKPAVEHTFVAPIHTDGFFSIRMINGSIRIPIFSFFAASDEPPKPVITGVLEMSLESFLKSAEIVEDYTKNLVNEGVIKKS